ncbi:MULTISPECIES: hypothetical protein [unclassified Bradyrhizobium]|uniref:hypothetical protein n=1 Tax=unclassified Bradyrhizobium TaxID=2631580 RepID=UPI00102E2AEA|nr:MULTISPECIES: hypothetical protein [unclassified Bradyrhizobium]MDI4235157.1 hypothetical protein [Bradyrhizobium sp. Arg237L]TAI66008.1 hypothetical protein CWO89_10250 [Bradyrhizobium sp. Leo170]
MKRLAITLAVGAAALIGSAATNAADRQAAAKTGSYESQSTDLSARGRGHHHHHYGMHRHHHHYGYHRYGHHRHGYYRPYYNSYGYQRPYYGGGPGVTFSFGSGGYRGW